MTVTTTDLCTTEQYIAGHKDGFAAGRIAERKHCNNVLKQFFKTFKFNPKPTIEDAEKHNA